jgi:uncharacterized protein (DUF2236 family)
MFSALLSRAARPLATRLLRFNGADFLSPAGEPAIVASDSVSWQVFRNPVSLYIGGVAAVLLELGEPRVRTGVWDFSSFRSDPEARMRRTGAGAMITVYAARSRFEAYVRQVNALHAKIEGVTPAGRSFRADDPELLGWVQATASFAFLAAYRAYVRPLSLPERDRYYREAGIGAAHYGVPDPPASERALEALFAAMEPRLEPSPVIHEFLDIMRTAPILPAPLRPLQRLIARAAVDLLPRHMRRQLGIEREPRLTPAQRILLGSAARTVARVHIPDSPWSQACVRLGLPPNHLDQLSRPASGARPRS